jgi:hypothetical protein
VEARTIEQAPARVSPLLGLTGAVAATGPDAGVAAHYGEPLREQRALAAGEAIVDCSNRGVVRVTGPDRLSWLDSLTSQRLTGLAPGDSAETLLLDPSGRLEHAAAVVDDGEATWLITEAAEAAPFAAFLDRMRFLLRVEVADVTDDFAVVAGLGAVPALPELGPVWHDPWIDTAVGGVTRAAGEHHPGADFPLWFALLPRTALEALAAAAAAGEVRMAGTLALEALRIAAWRPRFAREVDARTIPHELDWLRSAVHLTKGCYRGQETVAKVHNLGRPPRRLVQLDLDGSDGVLPAPGDAVLAGETEVGAVTSVALHHEEGPIALAVVKRSVPEADPLVVRSSDGPIAAAQRVIVPSDAGPAVAVPRLPRLGAVRRG